MITKRWIKKNQQILSISAFATFFILLLSYTVFMTTPVDSQTETGQITGYTIESGIVPYYEKLYYEVEINGQTHKVHAESSKYGIDEKDATKQIGKTIKVERNLMRNWPNPTQYHWDEWRMEKADSGTYEFNLNDTKAVV